MNEDMTASNHGGSDHADTTSETLITDFTRVASCAVANSRDARRRERIRAELVREHFDRTRIVSPSIRSRLLKLFRLN